MEVKIVVSVWGSDCWSTEEHWTCWSDPRHRERGPDRQGSPYLPNCVGLQHYGQGELCAQHSAHFCVTIFPYFT